MRALILPISSLLTGVGLTLLGTGLLNTLLALRGSYENFSTLQLGLLTSCYFAGFLAGSGLSSKFLKRAGYIRTFSFAIALLLASILASALWVNPWFWAAMRAINGIALVTLYSLIESWLNGQTAPRNRGKVFGAYMMTNLSALACAQFLVVVAPIESATLFVLVAFFISLALVPVSMTRLKQPELTEASKVRVDILWHRAPVALTGAAFSGLVMGAFWGMMPVFAVKLGMHSSNIAAFIAAAIVGGALMQIPIGRYSDTHDRPHSADLHNQLCTPLCHYFADDRVAVTRMVVRPRLFCIFVWRICVLDLPNFDGALGRSYPAASTAIRFNRYATGARLGAAIGPLIAGQLMHWLAAPGLPAYLAITLSALIACTLWLTKSERETTQTEDQSAHFVPLIRTTPTAMELYPDAAPENANSSAAVTKADDAKVPSA